MPPRGIHFPSSWLTNILLLLSAVLLLLIAIDSMLGELSLLCLVSSIFAAPTKPTSNPNLLRFTSEGTFQLSIFEDLHYGEGTVKHSSQLLLGAIC